MIYEGKCLTVDVDSEGIAELKFDLEDSSVNTMGLKTVTELSKAVAALTTQANKIKGLIFTSAKKDFMVGANIFEFLDYFDLTDDEFEGNLLDVHKSLAVIEDFPFPTVCAINGLALGGGFELPLATDYRIITTKSKVGLPEISLGIFPGWGGSFRLPRLIGMDNALEWIATAKPQRPADALKKGAVDAVVETENLRDAAITLLQRCINGELNYEARREEKRNGILLNDIEMLMSFTTARGMILAKAGPHYPAPKIALDSMQRAAKMHRDDAMIVEVKGFVQAAKTDVAANLVGLFLNDQMLNKQARKLTKNASKVSIASVIGAGVMGGGVAYQSALKGTPIVMKDINEDALQLGFKEAKKLLRRCC